MSTFNIGDRVRYNGNHPTFRDQAMIGKLGTVETYRPTGANIVSVRWDNGASTRVYVGNVQNLTQDKAKAAALDYGLPAGTFLSYDYGTAHPSLFAPLKAFEPEPTIQESLRTAADQADEQVKALQFMAAACRRLADATDRLENLTK